MNTLKDYPFDAQSRAPLRTVEDDAIDELASSYRMMSLIRAVERQIAAMVESSEVSCPCHLAIGQEAVPVGVSASLTNSDVIFGAHRSHGHFLAQGGSTFELFAEILGKSPGASKGLGGSMHLRDPEIGVLGTVPIVGATIPIAVGAGLRLGAKGDSEIAVTYFGDGATEEGVFHESMNLASVQGASTLFVCENNLFSSHLEILERQPEASVARYADAHGVESAVVDGNDIFAVREAAKELIAGIRSDGQPRFLEAVTYRWLGHVGHREDLDVGVARAGDLGSWKTRDPLAHLETCLLKSGVEPDRIAGIEDEVTALIESALDQARNASFPEPSLTLGSLYS